MRKNKSDRKRINLYSVYRIEGLNLDSLVNNLKNNGIELKQIKKIDNKHLTVAVNYADNENFFAITQEMCYNIKRIGYSGKFAFALKLWQRAGLVIGAIIFALILPLANDFVFSLEFTGSGKIYEREVTAFLASQNVKPFSRFSQIDLPSLSDVILQNNDKISFAECVKNGNRLKIELVAEKSAEIIYGENADAIFSDCDGVIEDVKVYRGTLLKNVGDAVKKGEELCSGYALVKDKTVKVGAIATIALRCEYVFDYGVSKDGEEEIAEALAVLSFGNGEIIDYKTEKTPDKDGLFDYKVKIIYRRIVRG